MRSRAGGQYVTAIASILAEFLAGALPCVQRMTIEANHAEPFSEHQIDEVLIRTFLASDLPPPSFGVETVDVREKLMHTLINLKEEQ